MLCLSLADAVLFFTDRRNERKATGTFLHRRKHTRQSLCLLTTTPDTPPSRSWEEQNLHAGDNTFLCPNVQGTYLVLVRTQRHGTTHTLKLIVQ